MSACAMPFYTLRPRAVPLAPWVRGTPRFDHPHCAQHETWWRRCPITPHPDACEGA